MKVYVLKRLVKDGEDSFCDVWVASTEAEVKKKAVDSVIGEWFYAFGDAEKAIYSTTQIFNDYVDYWKDEEQWELIEETL